MIRVVAFVQYPLGAHEDRATASSSGHRFFAGGLRVTLSPVLSRRGLDGLYEAGHVAVKAGETLADTSGASQKLPRRLPRTSSSPTARRRCAGACC